MCCSLECGAKVIGWLQIASCVVLILNGTVDLITAFGKSADPEIIIAQSDNLTIVEIKEESVQKHDQYEAVKTMTIVVWIILIIIYFFIIALASALLTGIRKRKPKLVWMWIVVNGAGCCLAAGIIFIEMMSMLLATDPGSLTGDIILLVLNVLQVWVVYNYYEDSKDAVLPAY